MICYDIGIRKGYVQIIIIKKYRVMDVVRSFQFFSYKLYIKKFRFLNLVRGNLKFVVSGKFFRVIKIRWFLGFYCIDRVLVLWCLNLCYLLKILKFKCIIFKFFLFYLLREVFCRIIQLLKCCYDNFKLIEFQ